MTHEKQGPTSVSDDLTAHGVLVLGAKMISDSISESILLFASAL